MNERTHTHTHSEEEKNGILNEKYNSSILLASNQIIHSECECESDKDRASSPKMGTLRQNETQHRRKIENHSNLLAH